MKPDNKLFNLLRTFTARDFRLFNDFLNSPYFNKQQVLIEFFHHLKKYHPHYEHDEFDKQKLFKMFFPEQKFDDKKLRYLTTDLTRLAEKYLSIENLQHDDFALSNHLLHEHTKRENVEEFGRHFNVLKLNERNAKIKDGDFFLHHFLNEFRYINFAYPRQSRKQQSNMERVLEHLDKFYLHRKLQLLCEVVNVKSLLAKDYKVFMQQELIAQLQKHPYSETPVIQIYLVIYKTLTENENEKHFEKLSILLKQFEEQVSKTELFEMYQYLMNYCIRKINSGKQEYLKKLFEIYKTILANKVIMQNDVLSQWDFKNITTIALRLKEFAWTKKFIDEYQNHLPKGEQNNAVIYNTANLHFQKAEFSKALKLLRDVEFTDLVYQLDTRSMLLKIYFETDDEEALHYHATAFKTFLKRNKLVSKTHQLIYNNLIRYTEKLMKYQGNKKLLHVLKTEIENNSNIADAQWLKFQVGQISNLSLVIGEDANHG
ncbi:MAG: hypothetical protein ABI723_01665 [Bacteroidia bacterium]